MHYKAVLQIPYNPLIRSCGTTEWSVYNHGAGSSQTSGKWRLTLTSATSDLLGHRASSSSKKMTQGEASLALWKTCLTALSLSPTYWKKNLCDHLQTNLRIDLYDLLPFLSYPCCCEN